MGRKRIDLLLVERGYESSRERAKALIMAGAVSAEGRKIDKPGEVVEETSEIHVKHELRYVSRGGLKLEKAIDAFSIELKDITCLDVGASTGGFTDCMLQNGAARVYAVDVGYGQLAWKLRTDPRVISMERTNIRFLTEEILPERIGFFSIDISFISLEMALPVVYRLLLPDAQGVCLIKPQFEAGRDKVGKKGVVRDSAIHEEVIKKVIDSAAAIGFCICGLDYSPVKGPEGNIEYLLYLKTACQSGHCAIDIKEVVYHSHLELNGGA